MAPLSAQVIKVEAGASDAIPSQGGSINFQSPNYEGYVGLGEIEGAFRLGSYVKTSLGDYKFTLGDQPISFGLPTDIFGGQPNFLTRGLGITVPLGHARVFLFGGATTMAAGSPLFQSFQTQTPLGMFFIEAPLSDQLHFYSRNVVSGRQSSIQGIDWLPRKWLKTGISAGVGSNKPYFGASADVDRNWIQVKAAYIDASDGFRRITTPTVFASEPDRENVLVTLKPYSSVIVTAGHQNLLEPQGNLTAPFLRASVDQLQTSFDVAQFRLGAGVFQSHSQGLHNVADGFSIGRQLTPRIGASASYYQTISGPGPHTSNLLGTVRETLTPKISLLQVVNRIQGNTSVLFGGSYTSNRFTVGVDYGTVYMPFLRNPLVTTIGVTLNLKLWGNFQVNGQTFRSPDGRLRYTASANTLLVHGFNSSAGLNDVNFHMDKYVVRGHVRDITGAPVEGAALRIGDDVIYSNMNGEFLVREKKAQLLPLVVLVQEFLTPLSFSVVSAPATVLPTAEDSAPDVLVVLRLAPRSPGPSFMPLTKPNVRPTELQPEPVARLSTEKFPAAIATVPAPQPVSPSRPEAVPATREVNQLAPPVSSPAPPLTEAELFDRNIKDIFFAFHRYDIRADQQEALKADAEFLNQHPGMRLLIEGHCDEAGTDAYNMVLGENRAQEVRAALIQEGVEPQRISIVSCGKTKPFCTERNASCHQENRRAHFVLVEGTSSQPQEERNTKDPVR